MSALEPTPDPIAPAELEASGKSRRWLLWLLGSLLGTALIGAFLYGWIAADPGRAMRRLQSLSIDLPLGPPVPVSTPQGPIMTWRTGPITEHTYVLIHGLGDAGAGWVSVAQGLAKDHHVLILDLPGHGRSTTPRSALAFDDLVAGLHAVLAQTPGQLNLVGNSLGGWVAADYALKHPKRVRELTLINSAGFQWPLEPDEVLPSSRAGIQRKNKVIMGDQAPQLPGLLLDGLVALHNEPWLRPLFDQLMSKAPKLDGRLGTFPGPIQLIWGTPDAFFPVAGYLERVQRERPGMPLTLLDNCGHAPQYSCPDALLDALRSPLKGGSTSTATGTNQP